MPQDHRLIPEGFDADASSSAPKLAIPLGNSLGGEMVYESATKIDSPLSLPGDEIADQPQSFALRTLNLRFLLFLAIAVVVAGAGFAGLREYQMSRLTSLYLTRSKAAEENEDFRKAANYLQQYIRRKPADVDARAHLAQLLVDGAKTPRARFNATMTMERLLRNDPDRHAIRRQLVDLLIEFGNYSGARAHLGFLLGHTPGSAELHLLMGRCYDFEGRTREAVLSLREAIQLEPRNLDAYQFLARTLSDNADQPDEADQTMDRMVERNRDSYEAYLARAQYHRHLGRREKAIFDVGRAFQLNPEAVDVLILIAHLLAEDRQAGENAGSNKLAARFDVSSMRVLIEKTLDREPERVDLMGALASLEWADGRLDAAERVLRQAISIKTGNADLTIALFDLLLMKGETESARQELTDLRQREGISPATEAFLDAHLAMTDEKWLDAARKLESIALRKLSLSMKNRISLDLAQCYAKLGNAERRLAAFRSAVDANKHSNTSRRQFAAALAGSGRHIDALAQYRQLPQSPAVRVEIARLLLAHHLSLPPKDRVWEAVDEAIEQAARDTVNRGNVALLRAAVLASQNRLQQAENLLEQTCKRLPDEPSMWLGWSRAVRENGRADRALEILAEAEQHLGAMELFLLERIVHWQQVGGEQGTQELRRLRKVIEQLPLPERDQPLRVLANSLTAVEQFAAADEILSQLVERNPDDLSLWLRKLDSALRAMRLDEALTISAKIRRLDGDNGAYWRFAEASRFVALASQATQNDADRYLSQARDLFEEVDAQFGTSPRVPLALAKLDERQGDHVAAAKHYIEAIGRGDRRRAVVARAVQLLNQAGKFNEALQILQQYAEQRTPSSPGSMGRLEIILSLRSQNYQAAIEIAQDEVDRKPTAANARLVLGQVFWAAKRFEEAERELREALKLEPKRPAIMLTLIRLLVATSQTEAALKTVEQARQQLPDDRLSITLAKCYQAVGQLDEAEKHFQLALKKRPNDSGTLIQVAEFYLAKPDRRKAESVLRRIGALGEKAAASDTAAARRALALLLVGRNNYPGFQEALSLLKNDAGSPNGIADLHARAVVLAVSPHREHHRQAVDLLEQLSERRSLATREQRLLTDLYLHLDNWEKARDSLLVLVVGNANNLNVLAFGVRTMFSHNDDGRLPRQWLESLVDKEPTNLQTIELRVTGLVLENRVREAVELIDKTLSRLTTDNIQRVSIINRFAGLLNGLGERRELAGRTLAAEQLFSAAEKMYRANAKIAPRYTVSLARFLSRRWRDDEAVALLDDIWKTSPPQAVAAVCEELLRGGRVGKPQVRRIRLRLDAAVRKSPESGVLIYHTGNVAQLDGDYAAAITYYKQAVQHVPKLTEAHNELAMLQILHSGDAQAALESIDRAIDISGPLSVLLDTRSLAYVKLKQPKRAIEQSQQAVADNPTPARRFHLAQALEAVGEKEAARGEFRKAIGKGLRAEILHPLEREAFKSMRQRFSGRFRP